MRAQEPHPLRIVLGIAGALLAAAPAVLLARWAGGKAAWISAACALPAGVVATLIVGSLGEWFVHRYAMHRGRRFPLFRLATDLHHRAHHWVHFTPERYVHAGRVEYPSVLGSGRAELCRSAPARALTVASHAAFYALFALPIALAASWATRNPWFVGSTLVTEAVLIALFIHVHDAIHYPGLSPLERFSWFRFLDRHHYIHHIDNGANTNFLLPLGDLAMGTLRRRLAADEAHRWPSYEEARARLHRPADAPA